MDTADIISSMVKGRECCRRLVQTYETARRQSLSSRSPGPGDLRMLETAETAATQMLSHLSHLPANPCEAMPTEEARRHTSQVLGDIRSLLEKAIMLEREMRTSGPSWAARSRGDGASD